MKLPNGARLEFGVLGATKVVTAISNASEGVVSSVAHGLLAGSALILGSGWDGVDGSVFEVGAAPVADSFKLAGANTTDVTLFPAGQGAGSVTPVTSWVRVKDVLEFSLTGGDGETQEVDLLDSDRKKKLPNGFSSLGLTVKVADDPLAVHFAPLRTASQKSSTLPFRLVLKDGSRIYCCGAVSFSGIPEISKGSVMTNKLDVAVDGNPTRY